MSIHGGDIGQARDITQELRRVYTAIAEQVEGYQRKPQQPFIELNLESGKLLTIFHESGLDYMNDMSGGNLSDRAKDRLEQMANNPHYQISVPEDGKVFKRIAKSNSMEQILGLLTPTYLAMIIAYEHDLRKKRVA